MEVQTAVAVALGALCVGFVLGGFAMHEVMDRAFKKYLEGKRQEARGERRQYEEAEGVGREI